METSNVESGSSFAKPEVLIRLIRVQEELRAQFAGLIELRRVKPVPAPRRQRQRSLRTILRQARAAGAARVEYGGAVIYLTGNGSPAAPAEPANPWDELLPPGGRHGAH